MDTPIPDYLQPNVQPQLQQPATPQAPADPMAELEQYIQPEMQEEKYGTLPQQAKTFLEGAGVGGTLGLSTGIERLMGVSPNDIRARSETNPISHGLGQGAGFGLSAFIPGAGEANIAKDVGEGVAAGLGVGSGTGVLSQIAGKALPVAADFVAMQGGDEVSKMLANDPNQSVGTAVTNIGLSGLLGLGGGAALGSVSPLWNATTGNKLGQFIEDFKGRMAEHLQNPNPAQVVHEELSNFFNKMSDSADSVYGAGGIKAQAIQKFLPEMSEKITNQVQDTTNKVMQKMLDLKGDPLSPKLENEFQKWQQAMSVDNTPAGIFDATQNFKQKLQEWGKYNKNFVSLGEKDFRDTAKGLAFDLRSSLENPDVWGKAADIQQKINKGFSEYLPTLKDFEKKFTTEINGERVVDPGKVSTYVNQLGKPTAEIKQGMVQNFIDASQKYQDVIAKTHADLGIEPPSFNSDLNLTKRTLDQVSPGAKAADIVIKKGLAGPAGMALGAGVGGGLGHLVGAGGIGALIGEHALGPFFGSILPALTKPLLGGMNSPEGMKAAVDYGLNVVKGESLIKRAAKKVFSSSGESLTNEMTPTEQERNKLDKKLKDLQSDQNQMFEVGGATGHYLPDHGTAISSTAMNAVNYMNSLRPKQTKLSPLDSDLKPNPVAKAQYERSLNIAQQPLVVLGHLKHGTITSQDVNTLKTLYPSLYDKLNDQLTGHVVEAAQKKEHIPYKTRLGLTVFTGQPMDSTLLPQAVAAAQPTSGGQQAPGAQTAQERQKHSMTALNKQAGLYQTPQQSREQKHTM